MTWSQSSFSEDTFVPSLLLDPTLETTALASWSDSPAEYSVLPPSTLIIHLIDVFFDHVHPQIRLLHQPSFVDWVGSGSYAMDEHATLILTSMFSVAARYTEHPEVDLFDRMLLRRASANSGTPEEVYYKNRKRWERGKGFLSQANRLLISETSRMDKLEPGNGETQRPSIRVVQAAAIITFAQMGIGLSSRTYSLLSTAVQLAHDCGLDQVDCNDEIILTPRGTDPDACKTTWVKKEELRRTWWVIAYLENFVCVTKDRPRMIDWGKCKTKLPCDDKDWFQGRHCSSDFLPASLDDLRASLTVSPQLSVLAFRLRTMHLGAKMLEAAMNNDSELESHNILTKIEECATFYKQNMPTESKTEYDWHFFAISNKIRGFKDAKPSDIFEYCRDLSRQRRQGSNSTASPGAKAFSLALSASETVCSILRDSSAEDVARLCPYLAYVLWVPACLQLLVKLFTRADPELAEKASLSLQTLIMTLERFGEFSALGQFVLSSFRRYEEKLTDIQWTDGKPNDDDRWIVSRVLRFPGHIDASFLQEANSIDHSEAPIDPALALYQLPNTQSGTEAEILQGEIASVNYLAEDPIWIWPEAYTEF
ncbi:hypothetical protein TrVFT333_001777 [Trichoderma virens FT-333]|nr:hypothetical protein TrVFT333_001777 [Trichoderma virens FT-333]